MFINMERYKFAGVNDQVQRITAASNFNCHGVTCDPI